MFYICIVIKERNNNNSNTVGIMQHHTLYKKLEQLESESISLARKFCYTADKDGAAFIAYLQETYAPIMRAITRERFGLDVLLDVLENIYDLQDKVKFRNAVIREKTGNYSHCRHLDIWQIGDYLELPSRYYPQDDFPASPFDDGLYTTAVLGVCRKTGQYILCDCSPGARTLTIRDNYDDELQAYYDRCECEYID